MNPSDIKTAAAATLISAAIVIFERAFPFIVFAKLNPPSAIRFIEKYLPPLAISCLLVYCLKDINFLSKPFALPEIAALSATVLLHLWKGNALLSIFTGTAVFMLLSQNLSAV